MKFTIYYCVTPNCAVYEYTWGRRVSTYSSSDLAHLIEGIQADKDGSLYLYTTTIQKAYQGLATSITPIWSKTYFDIKQLQSSILTDITAERPELLI